MGEVIYGRHAVLEALRGGEELVRLLLSQDLPLKLQVELEHQARRRNIPIERLPRPDLDRLHRRHQGVAAELAAFRYATLEDILSRARGASEPPLVLVLDLLQDPQNLGSLIRTAEAVGAHGAVVQERRAAGVTAAVHRASAGAVAHLPIARQTNLVRAIERLKEEGVWVCGLEADAAGRYDQADLGGPLALVVGSEGKGLRRLVRERCDFLVGLPMEGHVRSLNAAVAGSVVLYEAWRQRRVARSC